MATNIMKSYENHGIVESAKLKSTICGHLYSLRAPQNIDNGSVCAIGEYEKGDVWKAAVPKKLDKVTLVATSVVIYEDYTKKCQEEARFYNAKDDVMRCYELVETDEFAISAEAFAEGADPKKDAYVVVDGTGFKLTTVTDAPAKAEYGFIGQIFDIATNGHYRISVKQNKDLNA